MKRFLDHTVSGGDTGGCQGRTFEEAAGLAFEALSRPLMGPPHCAKKKCLKAVAAQ